MTMNENEAASANGVTTGSGLNGPTPLLVAEIVGILAVLGIMAAPLFCGRVNVNNDLGWLFLPTRIFYADCLAKGQGFDWMPQMFSGYYLTGSGDVGGYHPLRWLTYRWLPLRVAFEIELLAAYPFMLLGMFCWLRRLAMPREVAAAGAMMFTFSSFCMLHFLHVDMVAVAAHLPWMLAAIDVVVRNPLGTRRMAAGLAIALLTGSQLLLATSANRLDFGRCRSRLRRVAVLVGRKESANGWAWPRWAARICLELVLAVGVGGMIGAVQVLPMADVVTLSVRKTTTAEFANSMWLDPLNVVQLVARYMFKDRILQYNTHEFGLYAGAVPLLLIFWLRGRGKELGGLRGLVWPALALVVLGLDLSFGALGPALPPATLRAAGRQFSLPMPLPDVGGIGRGRAGHRWACCCCSARGAADGRRRGGNWRRWGLWSCSACLWRRWAWCCGLDTDLAWVMASPLEILAGPLLFGVAACSSSWRPAAGGPGRWA